MTYLLALDQGTTSSRSIVFNPQGQIVAMAQQEITQIYPQPGWVEHDPLQIWQTQLATMALLAAQKLQGGPLADAIRFPDHAETLAKLKQAYANDPKAQRLLTLINALR